MLPQHVIYGGTFDPVHRGHLAAAEAVFRALEPADFRFLPAGNPPHRERTFAGPEHRLRMLQLALAAHPEFTVDCREMERSGPSRMSLTLRSLRAEFPEDSLVLLLGQDAANGLDRWHEWRSLLSLAHLLIMNRPGEAPDYSPELAAELAPRRVTDRRALARQRAGCVLTLQVDPLPISSTQLRASVHDPQALRAMLPEAVAAYLEAQKLYR